MQKEKLSGHQNLNDTSTQHESDGLRSKMKAKAKRLLRIDDGNSSSGDNEEDQYFDAIVEGINQSAAFDADNALNTPKVGKGSRMERTKKALRGTADAIIHPVASAQSRATRETAGELAKSRPYLSNQANLDFLEAHDDLQQARDAQNTSKITTQENQDNIDHCEEKVQAIERKREEMRVAWVTDRHVQRVRAVDKVPPPFPPDRYFETQDDHGFTEFNWAKWIGYKLLHESHSFTAQYIDDFEELPFNIDTLRRDIERIIIVSAPLQEVMLDIRRIYRWEDQWRTSKWLISYLLLWYSSYMMSFLYAYIVYKTAKNYYYPSSVDTLREEFSRSFDEGSALKAGELMDKHGEKDWLGPLLEQLGPFLQLQIADLANLLEVYDSFFYFRRPQNTLFSLSMFVAVFLISACTSIQFTMRMLWFGVGLVFFGCWPISSLYPRYRLLVSPLKWAFWDIPTYPEWALQYLQDRGSSALREINSQLSKNFNGRIGSAEVVVATAEHDTDSPRIEKHVQTVTVSSENMHEGHKDILSFGCTYHNIPGHLIVSTDTIRFEAAAPNILPRESFHKPYSELIEMSKEQTDSVLLASLASLAKVTTGKDKLELRFRGEEGLYLHDARQNGHMVVLLENMRQRDKAFNSIIAFSSGVRWQCLQKATGKHVGAENPISNASRS
ncbi:hypothetical protein SBOR_9127 [Sclerotinia borealis F-4128]|uniref:GRAM domain-containing protein n=1 Tax=Sclerotinia borealis (strain F-4128) TaxID=1432307 RepID=W9C119_SCLBF|nr:hypothetical protein SBOR_9127 [Sclerotinia borealis F-4128]